MDCITVFTYTVQSYIFFTTTEKTTLHQLWTFVDAVSDETEISGVIIPSLHNLPILWSILHAGWYQSLTVTSPTPSSHMFIRLHDYPWSPFGSHWLSPVGGPLLFLTQQPTGRLIFFLMALRLLLARRDTRELRGKVRQPWEGLLPHKNSRSWETFPQSEGKDIFAAVYIILTTLLLLPFSLQPSSS